VAGGGVFAKFRWCVCKGGWCAYSGYLIIITITITTIWKVGSRDMRYKYKYRYLT